MQCNIMHIQRANLLGFNAEVVTVAYVLVLGKLSIRFASKLVVAYLLPTNHCIVYIDMIYMPLP